MGGRGIPDWGMVDGGIPEWGIVDGVIVEEGIPDGPITFWGTPEDDIGICPPFASTLTSVSVRILAARSWTCCMVACAIICSAGVPESAFPISGIPGARARMAPVFLQ